MTNETATWLVMGRKLKPDESTERLGSFAGLPIRIDRRVPVGEAHIVQGGRVVVRIINAFPR